MFMCRCLSVLVFCGGSGGVILIVLDCSIFIGSVMIVVLVVNLDDVVCIWMLFF